MIIIMLLLELPIDPELGIVAVDGVSIKTIHVVNILIRERVPVEFQWLKKEAYGETLVSRKFRNFCLGLLLISDNLRFRASSFY